MRVKRRLAVCFGLALLLLGGRHSVLAQNEPGVYQTNPGNPPPTSNGSYAPAPNFSGPAPAPTSFNGSLANPEYSNYPSVIPVVPPPLPADTYGAAINPYPAISPYDYSYQNDTNVGGIWEHTERTRDRKYYFTSDFLFMSTKPPSGIFGNPKARPTSAKSGTSLTARALPAAAVAAAAVPRAAPAAPIRHRNCCRTRGTSPKRRPTMHRWRTTTTPSTSQPREILSRKGRDSPAALES
jgi:hypothetical protein